MAGEPKDAPNQGLLIIGQNNRSVAQRRAQAYERSRDSSNDAIKEPEQPVQRRGRPGRPKGSKGRDKFS